MEIFTYRARSLQEALMLVRHELGPEASVIQTREISGRLFGLLGKPSIEVQASRDAQVIRRLPNPEQHDQPSAHDPLHDSLDHSTEYLSEDPTANENADDTVDRTVAHTVDPMDDRSDFEREAGSDFQLREPASDRLGDRSRHRSPGGRAIPPRSMPQRSMDTSDHINQGASSIAHSNYDQRLPRVAGAPNYLTPAMFEVFTEMLDADVDPDAARLMLQEVALHCSPDQLDDPWLIKGRLCQFIQQRIEVSGPIEINSGTQQVVALVGPTGVGKTTTLAKLAAGFHFDQGTQVGFVTLDTFRLGAVDQLQKYADLLGAPCETVAAPDQMLPALERLRHCHLVLIDTAGRSPRDQAQLKVLNDFLQVAQPDQIHLVLSAASSQAHAQMAMEHFRPLAPTHLLLTKLDESVCLGSWYRLLSSGVWPLSYLTTGQHVPEDILVANRRRVASLILGQSN